MEWEELGSELKAPYYDKARYLIENGYAEGDIEELAKKIFQKAKSDK